MAVNLLAINPHKKDGFNRKLNRFIHNPNS